MLSDQNLGLAIIAPGRESKVAPDGPLNFLVQPQIVNGKGGWYVLGVWDQENGDNLTVNAPNAEGRNRYGTLALPLSAPRTFDSFIDFVSERARRITEPARIEILLRTVAAESAPPDTQQPAHRKTYAEAINL